ncbi:acetyltransferase [Desulfovibrio sp. An276]|uniref:WcbI family polysaccharide biosynthesis putative acetyltransferase n=1 Tax=Desulfovibrio sp. An276 TaxID=1965618 RepID=UPI000B37F22A|nr:WcbI family polysaccharide biosynthesis putative acetyltransferase [Desulfovibrio sp. An276]OUO50784.1 acetyltransferase [Desulfovibrio sp. An276]
MKKKCMIYGNCQHTHLEHFLEKSEFVKYFELIKIKDVYIKDKTYLDDNTLKSLDCFIYQHISHDFDPFFCTDSICSKLRSDCIRISIPNFWLSAYFPQHIYNPVIRPNKKYSIAPSGIFPYGDENINKLLSAGISNDNIVKILSDPDFYDYKTVISNVEKTLSTLEEREKQFLIDIPSVYWIRKYLTSKQICVTVNHPTRDYFIWLANSILSLLEIRSDSCDYNDLFPFSHHIHVPIYPSVIKHLGLNFITSDCRYAFYNESNTFEQYILRYIDHATGSNIPGKDSIGIDRVNDIFSGKIKLLPCERSKQKVEELKKFFTGYNEFSSEANVVIWGEKQMTYPANSSCKDIPGLSIIFDGTGNLIWIHKKAIFNKSIFRLHKNGYIHIGNSRFGNLFISNKFHCGGGCFIDDGCCICGDEIKINLYGHNFCTIGKGCIFDDKVKIMCSDGHTIFNKDKNIVNINKPVYIGDHVWIGYGVTLLKGTYIPSGCCVAAGSIVNKKFKEENSILAGTPANCIKSNIEWSIKNPEDF